MIFQKFSQNKYKIKRENHCHVTWNRSKEVARTVSEVLRSLNNRFCGLERKNEFGPKLREAERTFSDFYRDLIAGRFFLFSSIIIFSHDFQKLTNLLQQVHIWIWVSSVIWELLIYKPQAVLILAAVVWWKLGVNWNCSLLIRRNLYC